jgi:hypothetical protein
MKRSLSSADLAQLDAWIQKRGYPYIDVRLEILDHVACGIENIWEEHPQLSLQEAYEQVRKQFGIFGFSGIEEAMVKAAERRLLKGWWQALMRLLGPKSWSYTLPGLALLYVLANQMPIAWLLSIPIVVCVAILAWRIWLLHKETSGKKYLSFRMGLAFPFLTLPLSINLLVQLSKADAPALSPLTLSLTIAFLLLLDLAQALYTKQQLERARTLINRLENR